MKSKGLMGVIAAVLLPASAAHAGTVPQAPQVGDTHELTLVRDSVQRGSNGSSGNSHDNDAVIETVIGVRADGLELQYDLPKTTTADERARVWQFPVRAFKPFDGPAHLLNGPELEARVDNWLKAGNLPRTACGHWIFTWNAFRIECDPQSVIKSIQAYDLRSIDLREGGLYQDAEAGSSGKLTRKAGGANGETLAVEMPVDADVVRRARADSDVVIGEIMNKPVTLEAALHNHAADVVAGTISVAFETDPAGNVRRRTKVTKLEIKGPDGHSETQTVTETLERRRVARD